MNSPPLVSVCIPTYNHARVIGDALRSATEQSYRNLEILIVDNHSDDDTEQVVAGFAGGDPRVRYVRNPENIGMARNFSACVALARGEYIKMICADDTLEPGCVGAMVDAMEGHSDIVLVGCARRLADERMAIFKVVGARKGFAQIGGQAMIKECFSLGNRIGEPSAVMFKRADAQRGFDGRYSQLVDLEMWLHLLQKGDFAFLPEPLCSIRQHPDQATRVNLRHGRIVEDKSLLFRDFAPALAGSMNLVQKALWDGRMALSLAHARLAGNRVEPRAVREIFFPGIFASLTYPSVALLIRSRLTGA
jgi:glycosyltransferase involved in cell wall biosynthesis